MTPQNLFTRRIVFSYCVLLVAFFISAGAAQAQDEAAYQKALSEARAQSNPSEHRAQALKKLVDGLEETGMSETQLNEYVAGKFTGLMEIDFYAAFLAQAMPPEPFIKWREVFELLPAEQIAAIKKLGRWKTAGGSQASYPAGIPKPGSGWQKTAASSVSAKSAPVSPMPAPPNPPAAVDAAPANSSPTVNSNPANPPSAANFTEATKAFDLGNKQFGNGDYDAAIRAYTECLRLYATVSTCYSNRGLAHSRKGNYEAALADYTQAIKLDPRDEEIYINRASVYIKQENFDAAIADFKAALKINPLNQKVKDALQAAERYKGLRDAFATDEKNKNSLSEDFYKQGNALFKQRKFSEAIPLYTKCIEAAPLNLDCYNARGLAYNGINDFDKAIVDFTAILLIKKVPVVYYRRGTAYLDKKDFEAALKDFNEAVRLAPDDPLNYAARGEIYALKNDYAAAIADFTQAIKRSPQEAKYYFYRGVVRQFAGEREAAIADYKKSLQIDPNFDAAKKQLESLGVQP